MRRTIRIGDHLIGAGHAPYVIAEIGSNHDDNLETAQSYIWTAAWCGADAAKFQLYREHNLYPGKNTPHAIPDWWLPELKQTCEDAGLDFLCSVFDTETLAAYLEVDPPAVKIASPESHNNRLVTDAALSGLPVLVATGASNPNDVLRLYYMLTGYEYALLHCTSAYPAPDAEANLQAIKWMRRSYGPPVGFSDHTMHGPAPVIATMLGASIIEKHLTFNRTLPGPDHGFALEPAEFRQMVGDVRRVAALLGDGVKRVMPSEDATDRRAA